MLEYELSKEDINLLTDHFDISKMNLRVKNDF